MKIPVVARVGGLGGFLWLAGLPVAQGQQYAISTIAGGAPLTTPVTATSAPIGQPRRVAVDSSGNLYYTSGNCVYKVTNGKVVLLAGTSRPGFSGDGGLATNAQLNTPNGVLVDSAGKVYVADTLNNRVRVIGTDGIITTFAGNGSPGSGNSFGDGGWAVNANLFMPMGLAKDSSGNIYITDTGNNMVRKVSGGVISTVAGDGMASYSGDTKAAPNAELNHPEDVAVDSQNNIIIADTGNALVRRITGDDLINVFAGSTSEVGTTGDGNWATAAGLLEPYALALDSSDNLYIVQREDARVRMVDQNGKIHTVIGTGSAGFAGDGGAATSALLYLPTGIAIDSSASVYLADFGNCRIRKALSGGSGTISTVAGNGGSSYSGDGAAATAAQLNAPQATAIDASGNIYFADTGNNVIRKISTTGVISTVAGTGAAGYAGDGSAATSAQLNAPTGVAVDSSGNLYIADTANSRVRKVTTGTISTYAGSGTAGYAGDGSTATSARLNAPVSLALDSSGNLYIADYGNNVVRKVTSAGVISTVAGTGAQGYSGDSGKATSAAMWGPQSLALDSAGNLYIADSQNNRIRVVASAGTISTVAGTGVAGYTGDGSAATKAQIASPSGLAVDSTGNLYFTDSGAVVRKVYPGGIITTIAGTGSQGYSGDGGLATSAALNVPTGLTVDSSGNIYIADSGNSAIRQLQVAGFGNSISAVASAASNQTGSIAPGEVVVIYGSGLGPAAVTSNAASSGVIGTTVGGTTVYFNGQAAPILYSSATQVSAIVPFGITATTVQVYVAYNGASTAPVNLTLTAAAPALFTSDSSGKGQAAASNSDGTANGTAHPASGGTLLTLWATGFGQTNPAGTDGLLGVSPLAQPGQSVTATIGGKNANVQYAGGALNVVAGIMQLILQVPSGLSAGSMPVVVTVGGVASPSGVTVAVSGK